MSQIKRELERLEILRIQAEEIAKEAKAIVLCSNCEEEYVRETGNDEADADAYAMATAAYKRGEVDGTLQEIRDAVERALSNANLWCPVCGE